MPRPGCLCLGGPREQEIRTLNYCHCSLDYIPSDVFTHERTLEELLVDCNQIKDLPRELFFCHGLRKLCISDNEITLLPPAVGTLTNLEYFDFSKNGIIEIPENIKGCKYLRVVEASVNPLGKLTEGFTQLLQLTELYLNDTFLDFLPGSFGRLSKLRILELRENHLKTLPRSMARLSQLERLDIGNNEFSEMPEVVGSLTNLLELWCDTNQITEIPEGIGNLKQLMFLDASKNKIKSVAPEIANCVSLADLHLSNNSLPYLPESLGRLSNLTTLKLDDNRLTSLPFSLGGLVSLSELNVGANDIEELPPSIGLLRHLRTLYADENLLVDVPCELGSCSGLTVLSLRSNNLSYIPDEIGRIPRLRVLNLSDNKIRSLPFSLTRLKQLQALWLAENQTKPLIKLQSDIDHETGQRVLTCYLLPQQSASDKDADLYSDNDSFHPSLWEEERLQRQQIHFDFADLPDDAEGRLQRTPTPYPKEMKQRIQHIRNLAMKQLGCNTVPSATSEPRPPPLDPECQEVPCVLGRRDSPQKIGRPGSQEIDLNLKERKPLSPSQAERHLMLKADKDKMMKDKERLNNGDKGESSGDTDDGGFLDSGSLSHKSASHLNSLPASSAPFDSRLRSSHQASSVPGNLPQVTDMSYIDFLRGLEAQGVVIPKEAWLAPPPPLRQHPSSNHSHRRHSRRRGYDSDTGCRSDTSYRAERRSGYYSDTGYRSDSASHRSYRPLSAGSRSNGYYSDMDYRRPAREPPVVIRDIMQMDKAFGPQQPYRGVPLPTRTTIRNDELYDPYVKKTTAKRTQMHDGNHNQVNVNNSPSPRVHQESDRRSVQSESVRETIREEREQSEGNSEDEQWKNQLYNASIKLQKSPTADKSQDLEKSSSERQLAPSLPDCVPQTGLTPSKQQQPHPGRSPQSPTSPLHQPRFASPARSHVGSPVRSQQDLLQKSMDSLSLRSSPQRLPSPARSEPWLNNSIRSPRSRLNNFTDAEKRLSQSDQEPPTPQLNGSSQYDKDVAVYKREPHSQVSSSTDSGYGHGQLMDSGRSFFSQMSPHGIPSPRVHDMGNTPSPRHQRPPSGHWSPGSHGSSLQFHVTVNKNAGLGFSIAGGLSSSGNPFRPEDSGIFITKVQPDGPAAASLQRGDKLLEVNGVDFRRIEHSYAVEVLRGGGQSVDMVVERFDSSDSSDDLVTHQV